MPTLKDGTRIVEARADNGTINATLVCGEMLNERQGDEYCSLNRARRASCAVELPSEYVAVLRLFAAKNDVRYYLNGINLEVFATMENGACDGRLVATNGHRLGMFRLKDVVCESPISAIIPLELLAPIKPGLPVTIKIGACEPNMDVRPITVTQNGTSTAGQSIDGRFPEYRKIFPRSLSGIAAQFNPLSIGDLGKAAKLLHGRDGEHRVTLHHNGKSGALIDLDHEHFTGIMMPMLACKDPLVSAPYWAMKTAEDDADPKLEKTA